MIIHPMSKSHPGYDVEIVHNDRFKLRVSIKNHDISSSERKFQQRSATLRRDILGKLKELSISSQIVIESRVYLDDTEFRQLREVIANIKNIIDGSIEAIPNKVVIGFKQFSENGEQFAVGCTSDTVIVLCPHHKNEQSRFLKNVAKAEKNIKAHSPRQDDVCNVIMMRLHPSASIENITIYANELLNASDDPGFDAIFLYQPSVIRRGDSSMISHHISFAIGHRYKINNVIKMKALIGGLSDQPSRLELRATNGGLRSILMGGTCFNVAIIIWLLQNLAIVSQVILIHLHQVFIFILSLIMKARN